MPNGYRRSRRIFLRPPHDLDLISLPEVAGAARSLDGIGIERQATPDPTPSQKVDPYPNPGKMEPPGWAWEIKRDGALC